MTAEEALGEYLVAQKIAKKSEGSGRADWYAGHWFYSNLWGVTVPIFPLFGFRQGLPAHDLHHMLNDYDTSWLGECETAAWELASGGCGRHVVYWIDRLLFVVIALVMAPLRTARAFREGWGQRNLYRLDPETLLALDLEDVRRYVHVR